MKNKYPLYILLLFLFWSCSTQKNTWLSRGYHNLTARYNVLFNGQQSFDKGVENTRGSVKNDFTNVLPVFAFSEASGAQAASSQMRTAIRKGHKLIEKHSITVKPKNSPSGRDQSYRDFYNQREFNRWVDEAWMLIGKAHIYSRDWYAGIAAFDMVVQTFPAKNVRFEAMLWMARAFIEMDDFENARIYLDRYFGEVDGEKLYLFEAMSTNAWFWIAQDNFEKALEYCRLAADNANDRWERIRWYYVLAQVAERSNRLDVARDAYTKVVKLNPEYEYSIHARIMEALLQGGSDNPEVARKELSRYAREYKNLDYRDQIYYAMAETWFWEGDTLSALTNLQLAAGYGGRNRTLAGNIYHRMAEVYFRSGDYIAADAYYDSTLSALPIDYEGISAIKSIKKKLNPLAGSLKTIHYEDSVQRIANLPEEERDQFIDNILMQLEQQQQEEEDNSFSDNTDDAFFYRNFANRGNRATDESGKWYFYNQTMVSLGEMEFEKRWGRRELKDNWRRASKQSRAGEIDTKDGMMPSDPFSGNPPGPNNKKQSPDGKEASKERPDRESLIDGLPLTAEDMLNSHLRVQTSRFNAGHILLHNFDKYAETVAMFEQLLRDFPQTAFREQTLMGIYMACHKSNNNSCTQHYGQVITDDYPDSRFADFVRDPAFFEKQEAFKQEIEKMYASAYNDFKDGYWSNVLHKTDEILSRKYEPVMPQTNLLNAVALSQQGRKNEFRRQLLHIVENYPLSSQANIASHWLELLNQGREPEQLDAALAQPAEERATSESDAEDEKSGKPEGKFVFEPDSVHHLQIVLTAAADVNQLMFHLANFNFDRFTIGGLQLETRSIGNSLKVLETGPFENKKNGMDYFFALVNTPSVFKINNAGEPMLLLVSKTNRDKLVANTDLEAYKRFFMDVYLPGSAPSAIVVNESEIPENSYVEQKVPGFSSVFSPNDEEVWGMIIVSGDGGDEEAANRFLPNFSRSVLRYRVTVDEHTLFGDTRVLLVKSFKNISDYNEIQSSLSENTYWNSNVAGDSWEVYPVSTENFEKMVKKEGNLEEYLDFLAL